MVWKYEIEVTKMDQNFSLFLTEYDMTHSTSKTYHRHAVVRKCIRTSRLSSHYAILWWCL